MKKLVMLVLAIAMLALPVMAMADVADDLKTALEAGSNYTLNGDVTLSKKIVIKNGVNVTLRGSGTITANGVTDVFQVQDGATLTIDGISVKSNTSILYAWGGTINVKNGTFTSTGAGVACAHQGGTINVQNGATFTGSGNYVNLYVLDDSSATISTGGKVASTGCSAATVEGNSTLTVNGGTIISEITDPAYVGVHIKAGGKLVVHSGTVQANGGEAICAKKNGSAEIYGGNITGGKKNDLYVYDGSSIKVSGGSFSDNSADQYVVAGKVLVKDGDRWVIGTNASILAGADLPKTGDTENLMMWVALMAMAVVGLVATRKMSCE